jgi:TorA maturation chaperone TorD
LNLPTAGRIERPERDPGAGCSQALELDELDRARAREYALLANLLTRSPHGALIDGLACVQGDASRLGIAHTTLANASRRCSEASVAREYFNLFVGLGRGQLLPYASHYLAGSLYARPLIELRDSFQLLGIERVSQSEPEDHIATLCEIMAALIYGTLKSKQAYDRQFFTKHLATWAPRFFTDLERENAAAFYSSVGSVGRTFLEIEAEGYSFPA